ncbi:MAG: YqeG family HAD IIIA-type phosphatase [Lachnospiraceae bacterium]|nr:YqeG family HAD IIIA-type phosphatase [Lachnospiraceae bacterium]
MLPLIYPDDYISSVRDIDFAALYEEGFRGIIFDIDNTLVKNNAPADAGARAFFKRLHSYGFKVTLLSNNKEPRVQKFADAVQADGYYYKAGKPMRKGYLHVMGLMGTKPNNSIFIGDQLFTDIWGGNRTGLRTVMVRPVQKWNEEIKIILKRIAEDFMMLFYGIFLRYRADDWQVPLLMSGRRIVETARQGG